MTRMAARSALTVTAGGVEIRHHLWITWTRIARNEVTQARSARVKVLNAKDKGQNWALEMEPEYMASLVAISACAHALDAIYGALKPLVPATRASKSRHAQIRSVLAHALDAIYGALKPLVPATRASKSRHAQIRSVLAEAFKLGNVAQKHWKAEFTWLFDLRDGAVHYNEESLPTVPHPIHGHGSQAAAIYCMETADRAVALLFEVLTVLGSPDRARNDQVRAYSEGATRIINDVLIAPF